MMSLREALRELVSSAAGKAGVALLTLLVVLSGVVMIRYPLNFGPTRWSNPAQWADNPKAVPPVWANLLPGSDRVPHRKVILTKPTTVEHGTTGGTQTFALTADMKQDRPPTFAAVSVSGITYYDRPPVFSIVIARPDGNEVVLYREVAPGPRTDEQAPFKRFDQEPRRISLTTEPAVANAMSDFFHDEYKANIAPDVLRASLNLAVVAIPDRDSPQGLKLAPGRYQLSLRAIVSDPRDKIDSVKFVLGGTAYGFMGTDSLGRDLAQGLAFGLPVALFIGIAASIVTTLIGASLGVISGYMGGKTDLLIQRVSDIISNVPLLPLLIFLVFVFGPHLLLIMLFLVVFSWPGLTILIRSMVLQIRSGQLIESAVAIGASKWRIMIRHVFPHTAPFVFAQMIFFAPAAILAEAGLSFLGLGDPSLPTWGQILEQGFRTGAVYLGFWWWIIPPGVLIIITAVTFMLLSLAMEPVVNPKLRGVR